MGRFFVVFIFVAFILSSGCHKACREQNYIFTTDNIFYPERDSIRVGDTIFLTCTINKKQRLVYFSDAANLGGNLIVSDIDSFNTASRGAVDKFDYFNTRGSLYSDLNRHPGNVKEISYDESDSSYGLSVGLIAREAGNYMFSYSDDPGVYRTGSASCGVANFIFVNANKNKHLYLFENLNGKLGENDNLHSYCVKVYE